MRPLSAFAQTGIGQSEEYKNASRAIKMSMRLKAYWADSNSWIQHRKSEKGKTYEEIHGVEKAKELKALRKKSRYWEYVTDEQRKINSQKAWDTPEQAIKTSLAQKRKPSKPEFFNLYEENWSLFIEQIRQAQGGGLPSHPNG